MVVALDDIQEFADRVARTFHPERIILFGSHARGGTTADSDVDLLVVMPFEGRPWQMAVEIRQRVDRPFPLDLLVRTPEQLRTRLEMGDPFLAEIIREGKVLYESPHD